MINRRGVFITGTDTNVGKTFTSALLVSALAQAGLDPGYLKPVQTGDDLDTETLRQLTRLSRGKFAEPVYSFPEPIAPSRAALLNGVEIRIDSIKEKWAGLEHRDWVVEGAGGLLVPLNRRETLLDLIAQLKISVLLVASTRLGTINHTLLSLGMLATARVPVAGIVLNGQEDQGLSDTLADFTKIPVLASIPHLSQVTEKAIYELAPQVFSRSVLEALFSGGTCDNE